MKKRKIGLILVAAAVILMVCCCLFGCTGIVTSSQITITFESNGGSDVEPISVKKGGEMPKVKEPTKLGYEFVGWYIDEDLTEGVSMLTAPEKDSVYYARWRPVQIAVTFTGEGINQVVYVDYGTDLNSANVVFPEVPKKSGFVGRWEKTFIENVTEPQTINAIYEVGVYSVTYYVDNEIYHKVEGEPGEFIISPDDPDMTNHYFYGWYYDIGYTLPCLDGVKAIGDGDISLYARFIDMTDMDICFDYRIENGFAYITGFSSFARSKQVFIIPEKIGRYTVEGIDGGTKSKPTFITATEKLVIIIPSSVKIIGDYAFTGTDIADLTFFEGLKRIGEGAFSSCGSLASVTVPSSVDYIGDFAFAENKQLRTVEFAERSELVTIGKSVFDQAELLENFTLPDSPDYEFSYKSFMGSGIKNINVPARDEKYVSSEGVLYSKRIEDDATYLYETLYYCPPMKGGEYTVREETAVIAEGAFFGNAALETVILPQATVSVRTYAFAECKKLITVVFSEGLQTIGERAFYNSFAEPSRGESGNIVYANSHLTVPASVISLGVSCFEKSNLRTVVFEDGDNATSLNIPDRAFAESALAMITLSTRTVEIGEYAFYRCENLSAFYFNKNTASNVSDLTKIGAHAFEYCAALNSNLPTNINQVKLPSGVVYIGDYAFNMGNNVTRVQPFVPSETTYIGDYAFVGTEISSYIADTSLAFPFEYLGKGAFKNCKVLQSVTFPVVSNFNAIPEEAFYGCESLGTLGPLIFSANITSVGDYAFYGCTGIESLTFRSPGGQGEGIKNIGRSSFESCTGLDYSGSEKRILPSTLETLGERAFYGCTSLTEIAVPQSLAAIPAEAFAHCVSLTAISYAEGCIVDTVGENGFAYCTSLVTASLPPALGLRTGSSGAIKNPFFGCNKLTSLTVSEDNACLEAEDGVIYTKTGGIYLYPTAGTGRSGVFSVGKDVSYIDEYAFYGVVGLTAVDFEGGTTALSDDYSFIKIADYAFAESSVTDLNVSYRVNEIGAYAFYGSALDTLSISDVAVDRGVGGNNMLYIKNGAFSKTRISEITVQKRVVEIGDYVFADCYDLNEVSFNLTYAHTGSAALPVDTLEIGKGAFSGNSRLASIDIPTTRVTKIGASAFENCRNMAEVSFSGISDNPLEIGDYAFKSNHYLVEIVLPDNIYRIGEGIFYDCTRLARVYFPDSVLAGSLDIPDKAFYGCYSLTSINLPASISKIGKSAFENSALSEIRFEDAENSGIALEIDDKAFYKVSGLTEIVLPYRLTRVGKYAFYGSGLKSYDAVDGRDFTVDEHAFSFTALTDITIPSRMTLVGKNVFSDIKTLRNVEIGSRGELELAEGTFENSGVVSVNFDCTVKTIGKNAFRATKNLNSLEIVPYRYFTVGEAAFLSSGITSVNFLFEKQDSFVIEKGAFCGTGNLTSLELTGDRFTIGDYAFAGSAISTLRIEATYSVEEIGLAVAYSTPNLAAIELFDGAGRYYSEEGILYERISGGVKLMQYPSGKIGDALILGEDVTEIGDMAFAGNKYLTAVIIFKKSVIAVSPSVETDINSGFTFYVDESVMGSYGFSKIETVALQTKFGGFILEDIGNRRYVVAGYTGSNKELTVPDKITVGGEEFKIVRIKREAFINNASIEKVTIGSGILAIEEYAFANAINLKEIVLGDNIIDLKAHVFEGCTNLSQVSFGKSLAIISSYAFSGCSSLNTVDMTDTAVKRIEGYAFAGCDITTLILGDGLETIGNNAFADNVNLATVHLPSSVTKIGDYVFRNDKNLIAIYIETQTIPEIESKLSFAGTCDGMRILVSKDMLRKFKNNSLWWNYTAKILSYDDISSAEGFENYLLEENLTGYTLVFYLGTEMDVVINSNLGSSGKITKIAGYAFTHYTEKVKFPVSGGSSVEIGDYAFVNAVNLEVAELGGVGSIGAYAFYGLKNLTDVYFADRNDAAVANVADIGDYAFYGCEGMNEVKLPYCLQSVGDYAFASAKLTALYADDIRINTVLTLGKYSFYDNPAITEVSFNCRLENIGDRAFAGCTNLFALYLNNNSHDFVATIGKDVFFGCDILCVYVPAGRIDAYRQNSSWQSSSADRGRLVNLQNISHDIKDEWGTVIVAQEGFVISPSANTDSNTASIVSYIGSSSIVEFPSVIKINATDEYTIVNIGRNENNDADNINGCVIGANVTEIIIPSSVTTITGDAFNGAASLRKVSFSGSSKLSTIGHDAFANCKNLYEVYLPSTVNNIGINAFANSPSLRIFNIAKASGAASLVMSERAFAGSGIETIDLPAHLTAIKDYAFYECKELTEVRFGTDSGLAQIGNYAFSKTGLEKISLPSSVLNVGDYTFVGSKNLRAVYLSRYEAGSKDSFTSVGSNAFDEDGSRFVRIYVPQEAYAPYSYESEWGKKNVLPNLTGVGNGVDGELYNYRSTTGSKITSNSDTVILTAYLGDKEEVVIPGSLIIGNYTCRILTIDKFFGNEKIKKISFAADSGVTTLEDYAFADCTALTAVVMSDRIENIGKRVFEKCVSLADITLSKRLKEIADYDFYECHSLKEIILPDGIKEIKAGAFWNCHSLYRLTVMSEDTEIRELGTNALLNTNGNLAIIVSDAKEGALVALYKSIWAEWADKIHLNTSVCGDYIVQEIDFTQRPEQVGIVASDYILQPNVGDAWKKGYILIQYGGFEKEIDLRSIEIDGKKIVAVKKNALINDTRVIFDHSDEYGKFTLVNNDTGFTLASFVYTGEMPAEGKPEIDLTVVTVEGKPVNCIKNDADLSAVTVIFEIIDEYGKLTLANNDTGYTLLSVVYEGVGTVLDVSQITVDGKSINAIADDFVGNVEIKL